MSTGRVELRVDLDTYSKFSNGNDEETFRLDVNINDVARPRVTFDRVSSEPVDEGTGIFTIFRLDGRPSISKSHVYRIVNQCVLRLSNQNVSKDEFCSEVSKFPWRMPPPSQWCYSSLCAGQHHLCKYTLETMTIFGLGFQPLAIGLEFVNQIIKAWLDPL